MLNFPCRFGRSSHVSFLRSISTGAGVTKHNISAIAALLRYIRISIMLISVVVLSNTFMFLPDQLRLPSGVRSMSVVFIHMNIHSSVICLHQAAVITAEKHSIDPNLIQQSHTRCLMAAEEIANIMRLVCHVDPSDVILHVPSQTTVTDLV